MKRILATLALIACGNAAADLPGDFFAAPFVGHGSIDVDSEYTLSGLDFSSSYSALGVMTGYRFKSGVSLAAFHFTTLTANTVFRIVDDYQLRETGALVGYTFNVHERLKVTPMAGFGDWTLKAHEGTFFYGEEIEKREIRGSDTFWRIQAELPFNRVFQMYLSYQQQNYDFGHSDRTDLGFKLEFL